MSRAEWLREKRRRAEERMDTLWAPVYDDRWGGYINPSHQEMVERFLALCPPGGRILDAGAGTGKYTPLVLASGRTLVLTDQSAGMLSRAREKYPETETRQVGLQELPFVDEFDGVMCVDAMENVCPEDWPTVLANFHRALHPQSHLYFTVEIAEREELAESQELARAAGLPVVEGELAHEDGYHYYPELEQVRGWLDEAGFELLDEATGDGYEHFLARRRA